MSQAIKTYLILFACTMQPLFVEAQVYFCNGKYTTQACSDSTKAIELKPFSRVEAVSRAETNSRDGSADQAAANLDEPPSDGSATTPPATTGGASNSGTFTRLRIATEPVWMLESAGAMVQVKSGEVIIKNVGRKTAQGVQVVLNVPGKTANTIKMAGPETLEPGSSGAYKLDEKPFVKRGTPLNIRIRCENCWK